jgi:hypothetical protein
MARIPIVGASYESRSVAADAERSVNFYCERIESGQGKAGMVLYPTPGLQYLGTLADSPVRGEFSDQGRVYAVAGGTLFEIKADFSSVVLGHVANDGRRASMRSNGLQGHQLFIVSGGYGYIYDTNTGAFTELTTVAGFPSGQAVNGTFLDGYFIVATNTSFQISGLFNGLTWDAADKAIRSMGADNIVCAFQNHRELWVWGQVTSEVWYNAGTASFPFAPIQGVFVEMGCGAPDTPTRFDNQVIWLAANRDGDRMVVSAGQYVPQRVSTHACETAWRRYEKTSDAIGFAYQEDGHNFYVLTFPTAQATWVYDAAMKLWHERAYWNVTIGQWEAHRANCHCRGFDKHIVGDRANGNFYSWSNRYALDNTDEIRRLRRTSHISKENQWLFFERLELEMEMGLQPLPPIVQTTPPQMMLRWSDDRGHTWSPEQWVSAGMIGEYKARAYWLRLGRSRDRMFEITMTSQISWHLIDGYLAIEQGKH